jgi:hypothetical protein
MRCFIVILCANLLISLSSSFSFVHGQEENKDAKREELFRSITKDISTERPLELKALEIRAKIYEPQVIYILDRVNIDIRFEEDELVFTDRIEQPILENEF